MKRTDQERIARELSRQVKKERLAAKREDSREDVSVGGYARRLHEVLMHDGNEIYNIEDEGVLEVLMEMKELLDDRDLKAAIRKAVKDTNVTERQAAIDGMAALIAD